jgi:hypothetical protein
MCSHGRWSGFESLKAVRLEGTSASGSALAPDARTALDEVELKTAHLVGRCRVGRAFEPGGEPLSAIDVAALRVRVELARSHVFDHTLTQQTDSVGLAHRGAPS